MLVGMSKNSALQSKSFAVGAYAGVFGGVISMAVLPMFFHTLAGEVVPTMLASLAGGAGFSIVGFFAYTGHGQNNADG
jgi:hypothetical protein